MLYRLPPIISDSLIHFPQFNPFYMVLNSDFLSQEVTGRNHWLSWTSYLQLESSVGSNWCVENYGASVLKADNPFNGHIYTNMGNMENTYEHIYIYQL